MTPESLRVKQWRESNKERYNANQKVLMKARRAKEKAVKLGYSVTIVSYKP